MNDVCQILGTEYPIIQGAMARIAESSLAAAVSNGGGLGIIASGGYDADWLRNEIRTVRKLTDKPFGVNLMLLMPNIEELIQVVCAEKVPVVTTGAGNPGKYMKTLKEAGIKVIPVVASVALAIRVERAGADAVIAEGTEAGGHIGEIATMALTPQVVDAVSIPVLAAGGIADGRGVAAAYMLGARGVQVGTRFVVASECIVSQNYKDAIIKARDTDTCATGRSTGHPVRVIKNKLAREILAIEKASTGEEAQAAIDQVGIGALSAAVFAGDIERGSVMSGQIAGMVRKEQPAAEMIREMFAEAAAIYADRASLF
ncbi:enoyl-[acyl-carrier-protein] reductase FabK [Aminipila butyrica]|uniref:Probable nitronate monooxygenase n=1 Tax=Aminipila butyrica TaxID=433296 RepID=A0A858BZE1_9FIRM|nr:enoyl-[acyl-carrier-protein] reductase FabK [Aminipila butyrica]QIB70498.1 enoyl-[acyl-carrier-protein] reductase FabK [Aminipila butyrica]